MDSKKKVYIAVYSLDTVRADLATVLSLLLRDSRVDVTIFTHSRKPAQHNRNLSVQDFLKTDCDYFMCVDEDIVPPPNVLDLVLLDKDVVGAVCPQWREGDTYFVVMDKVEGGYKPVPVDRRGGLQQYDAVGTGCMIIKRKVLEKVKRPFERKWQDGFAVLGLDLYFCEKARAQGFEVWAHWEYQCSHYKTIDLLSMCRLMARLENG